MLVETDDEGLLGLLQNKVTRNGAFRVILNKYQQQLYYFLRRMGLGHEDADELLQDIFVKFWKTDMAKQEYGSIKIILYHFAATSCLDYLRKHQAMVAHGLPAEQEMIIMLKVQEEFDCREIAQITSIPFNEVRKSFSTGISEFYHQQNTKN